MRFLKGLAALGLLAFPVEAIAQSVEMTAERWTLSGEASIVEHGGVAALRVGDGTALLTGRSFSTGVIEFDVLVNPERGFPGVIFRCRDENNCENIYLRPHMSGRPDAVQYAPYVNGITSWQIFSGPDFNARTDIATDRWLKVRLEVFEDSALLSLGGRPLMRIADLKGSETSGLLGFSSSEAASLFANVRVTPVPGMRDPNPTAPASLPDGTVTAWRVSEALPEAQALSRAASEDWSSVAWSEAAPETNGIVYLARTAVWAREKPTVIARFRVNARSPGEVAMPFGFSDRVVIFVNGRRLYAGADVQASRDYRFLGTVGFYDTLVLPLRAGDNDVAFVVTETGGGWAAAAKLEDGPATVVP